MSEKSTFLEIAVVKEKPLFAEAAMVVKELSDGQQVAGGAALAENTSAKITKRKSSMSEGAKKNSESKYSTGKKLVDKSQRKKATLSKDKKKATLSKDKKKATLSKDKKKATLSKDKKKSAVRKLKTAAGEKRKAKSPSRSQTKKKTVTFGEKA